MKSVPRQSDILAMTATYTTIIPNVLSILNSAIEVSIPLKVATVVKGTREFKGKQEK
jgi:hypothetical protein